MANKGPLSDYGKSTYLPADKPNFLGFSQKKFFYIPLNTLNPNIYYTWGYLLPGKK